MPEPTTRIKIQDEWSITDRWWIDEPIRRYFREVSWGDRLLIFKKEHNDNTWRILRSNDASN